jgi:hypothetical protein
MAKILLHCCCAPDALYCLKHLQDEGLYTPEAFFYNPNIYPEDEYWKRFWDMDKVAKRLNVSLYSPVYNPEEFISNVKGYEDEPEGGYRCALCYDFRLRQTARFVKDKGFDAYTTTLTISPHKSSDLIHYFGRKNAEEEGIGFIFYNFKKDGGFQKSVEMSKEMGLYRQKYCGCEYSM